MIKVSRNGATVQLQRMRIDISASPEFTAKYGAKVKALGGSYSRVSSFASNRHVYLPVSKEGIALADVIIRDFRPGAVPHPTQGRIGGARVAIVFDRVTRQGGEAVHNLPSNLSVHYMSLRHDSVWDVIRGDFAHALAHAAERGYIKSDTDLGTEDERRRQDVARRAREAEVFREAPAMLALLRDILANTDGSNEGALRARAHEIVNRIDGVIDQEVA